MLTIAAKLSTAKTQKVTNRARLGRIGQKLGRIRRESLPTGIHKTGLAARNLALS